MECGEVMFEHKEISSYKVKPIGIEPDYIWRGARLYNLKSAIIRYLEAHEEVPEAWVIEYNKLLKEESR